MRTNASSDRILTRLAETPFLDRLELASLAGLRESTVYQAVERLENTGLVASVPHATEHGSHTKRYCLTVDGVREVARSEGETIDAVLRSRPVTAQWQRLLLERLDALAVVYSVIETISGVSTPISVRLYRSIPLEAVVTLSDGSTIGIGRQGHTSDRTAFAKRMQRLLQGPMPGALLFLVRDETRLRHTRRMLSALRVPTFLALEKDVVTAHVDEAIWQRPGTRARFDMESIVTRSTDGGQAPTEPVVSRAALPVNPPTGATLRDIPSHLLPSALHPSDKRILDVLADWPGIAPGNLRVILGLKPSRFAQITSRLKFAGLVQVLTLNGNRLVLTDRALGLLARRDRTSVGVARERWSQGEPVTGRPIDWRIVPGRRLRQLLRHIDHTDAVHSYLASTIVLAVGKGWEVVQLDPPHRASRYFRHDDGQRSVHPDAFFMLRRGDETRAFFLEWERRAVRPSTMRERLGPYLRYYSTKRPLDDHGVTPTVLIAVEDKIITPHFRRVADQEMDRAGVHVPLSIH